MQETHCQFIPEWKQPACLSFGSNFSRGCGILINNPQIQVFNKYADFDGRLCYVDILIHDIKIRIICVYAPNSPLERKNFFLEELPPCLSTDHQNIVAGDFNCVESIKLDTLAHAYSSQVEVGCRELIDVCTSFNLYDSWRELHRLDRTFTWRNKTSTIASRLDRFYIPKQLSSNIDFINCPYSDHDLVSATLDIKNCVITKNCGKSYWKLNVSILEEDNFIENFIKTYHLWKTLKPAYKNAFHWWESVKRRIKEFCVEYSKSRRLSFRNKLLELSVKLRELLHNNSAIDEIERIREEIKSLIEEK